MPKSSKRVENFDAEPDSGVQKETNPYSKKYRILKTILLIIAWISFGIIQEMPRTTLEDFRILLNTNYSYISLFMIAKNIGYLLSTIFAGIILDTFLNKSDSIIAFGNILMILTNFILPWSKIYWFSWALFFINGCGAAIFEVGSSQMMLRLWHGISSSPISSTYGSYGIGAIIAAQLAKPFIKFNPIENVENLTANVTDNSTILPSDIKLQIPYGCGTILAAIVTIGLFISQYYELIELKKFKEYQQKMKLIVSTKETSVKPIKNTNDAIYCMRVQKMFFQNVVYKNKAVFIMFLQILFLCIIFMSVYAFLILNNFLLTFFTKGPAKLEIGVYINIYSLFWFFFIFGRLLSVFVAFKMNTFLFYGLIVVSSFVSVGLFTLPFFNSNTIPIYFILAIIGLVNGPLQPSGFMIATALLGNVKSIVIALFCTSFNLGAIFSQISAGYIFDNFKPDPDWFLYTDATSVYILPFLLFFYIALNLVVFFISFMTFKCSSKYVQNNTKQVTNE